MTTTAEKKTCSYVFEGWGSQKLPCQHPVYQNEERCVFHHENVAEKEKDFHRELQKYIQRCEEDNSIEFYNFGGFIFPEISFSRKEFLKNADFSESQFSGEVSFSESQFSGFADFSQSQFSRNVYFNRSQFSGFVYFNRSQFSGFADFDSTKFFKHIEVINAQFKKQISLRSLTCHESISLIDCFFEGLAYQLHQGEKISFNQCRFGEKTTFANTDCSRLMFINCNLSNARFLGADIKETRFQSCHWNKPKRQKYSQVADHAAIVQLFKKKQLRDEEKDKTTLLRAIYRQLKQNLEDNHSFVQSGDFHYQEMRIREKQAYWNSHMEFFILLIYRLVADYGESYWKLLFWIMSSFLGTASIIATIEAKIPFLKALKITLFGLIPSAFQRDELKDALLSDWSKGVIVMEGILIIILTTLFVMAIRRKFRR